MNLLELPLLVQTAVILAVPLIAILYFVSRVLPRIINDKILGLGDLERFGTPTGKPKGDHALVCGASWGGIISARVLLEHYERVTIYESEEINPSEVHSTRDEGERHHIPQAHFPHNLQPFGFMTFCKLFPSALPKLEKRGVRVIDMGLADFKHAGRWLLTQAVGAMTCWVSRALLESTVRSGFAEEYRSRVTIKTGYQVKRLVMNDSKDCVLGVVVQSHRHGEPTHTEETVYGDIVIDASGRSQAGVKWLGQAGIEVFRETFNPHVGYAGSVFKTPEKGISPIIIDFRDPREGANIGLLCQIEDGKTLACLCNEGSDYPPGDYYSWRTFADSMPSKEFVAQIELLGEPLHPIKTFHSPEMSFARYDLAAKRLPQNFYVVGDALVCFNPFYGQGLSTASMAAMTLDRTLRLAQPTPTAYFTLLYQRLQVAWLVPKSGDYMNESTIPTPGEDKKGLLFRFVIDYVMRAMRAASWDANAHRILHQVFGMTGALPLFGPQMLYPILREALFGIPASVRGNSTLTGRVELDPGLPRLLQTPPAAAEAGEAQGEGKQLIGEPEAALQEIAVGA